MRKEQTKVDPVEEEVKTDELDRSFEKQFGIVLGRSKAWFKGSLIIGQLGNSLDLKSKTGREGRVTFTEAFNEKLMDVLERKITPPAVEKVEWF